MEYLIDKVYLHGNLQPNNNGIEINFQDFIQQNNIPNIPNEANEANQPNQPNQNN